MDSLSHSTLPNEDDAMSGPLLTNGGFPFASDTIDSVYVRCLIATRMNAMHINSIHISECMLNGRNSVF